MNEYIGSLKEKYNKVSFVLRTASENVYSPFFQKNYSFSSLEEKSRLIFENGPENNYHIEDFRKNVFIVWNVIFEVEKSNEETVTLPIDDFPYFEHKISNWLLNVIQCFPAEDIIDTASLSQNEKKCVTLAFLQPNSHAVAYWLRFETNINYIAQHNPVKNTLPRNNLSFNCQFKFDQGFVKTFFSLTTYPNSLNQRISFLLPLTLYETGVLSFNGVNIDILDAKNATNISFQVMNKSLIINSRKNVPNLSIGDYTLILDITIFSKTATTEKLLFYDICIDTSIEESCSTSFYASPIYKTSKTALKYTYNISNVDIKKDYYLRVYFNVLKVNPLMNMSELYFTRLHLIDYHIVYKEEPNSFLATISENTMMIIPQLLNNHTRFSSGIIKNEKIALKIDLIPMMKLKAMPIQICVLGKRDNACKFEEMLFIKRKFSYRFKIMTHEISSVKILLRVKKTIVLHISENEYGIPIMINILPNWENITSLSIPCFVNLTFIILDASKNESIDDINFNDDSFYDNFEEEEEDYEEQDSSDDYNTSRQNSSATSVSHPQPDLDICKEKWMKIIILKKVGVAIVSFLLLMMLMCFAYYLRQYILMERYFVEYDFAINFERLDEEESIYEI